MASWTAAGGRWPARSWRSSSYWRNRRSGRPRAAPDLMITVQLEVPPREASFATMHALVYHGPLRRTLPTNVSGIAIGELLPLAAKQADKYTIIRSMTHGDNGH